MLLVLPLVLFLVPLGIMIYVDHFTHLKDWIWGVGLLGSFLLLILSWAIMAPIWRIWAFGRVRNVHELERKAIERNLIYPPDSWITKLEIRTRKQQAALDLIEEKFQEPDTLEEVKDDGSIGEETRVYSVHYSERLILYFAAAIAVFGIYTLYMGEAWMDGLIIIGVAIALTLVPRYLRKEPKLLLNEEGILMEGEPFVSWKQVGAIKLYTTMGMGRYDPPKSTLDIKYLGEDGYSIKYLTLNVSEFNLTPRKIEYRTKLYWQRYRQVHNMDIEGGIL